MLATMVAVAESFTFDRLVTVVAMLADKDVTPMLASVGLVSDEIVATVNDSPRALPADELAEAARAVSDSVHQIDDFDHAMVRARELAGPTGCVLATGSVVTAGMARSWAARA